MCLPCIRPIVVADPPAPATPRARMPSIDEDQTTPEDHIAPHAEAVPLSHRLVSQTVVGAARRPSLSLKIKREKVPGAADSRMGFEPSTPSEEEVRRFYALYGKRLEPHGRRTDGLPDAAAQPATS